MILQSIFIDGFKNISTTHLNLNNITALISENNYGKSNVLKAIQFGFHFIQASDEEKNEMMSNLSYIPQNKNHTQPNFKFDFTGITSIRDEEYLVEYTYTFSWMSSNSDDPSILEESLCFKQNKKNKRYKTLINRKGQSAFYNSSVTTNCSTPISVSSNQLLVNKLKAYDHLFYLDILRDISTTHVDYLDSECTYSKDELAFSLYTLQTKFPDKYEQLLYVYQQLFPEITNVDVRKVTLSPNQNPYGVSKNLYFIYVSMESRIQPVLFETLSTSVKKVLVLLTTIVMSHNKNVAIVEIETFEHSLSFHKTYLLLQACYQLQEHCKLIITSYSPYLVNHLPLNAIYIGDSQSKYGVAHFLTFSSAGAKKLSKDASRYDYQIGEYIFTLIEDDDACLKEYLQ